MRYDSSVGAGLDYAPCQYRGSRLYFRGPQRNLGHPYIAFLGGTETYGKFIEHPYPALVEQRIGMTCVNLGVPNGSVDAFLNDPAVKDVVANATLSVVQVMGAQAMSNRFYTVHPRRNDRFVRAATVLRALYPEVDFSDICFVRHLLAALWAISPDRFAILREELQTAWSARMRSVLSDLGSRSVLLWFAPGLPSDTPWDQRPDPLRHEPLFVTRRMIDQLRPLVRAVVIAPPSARAQAQGNSGMIYTQMQEGAASALPGPAAHAEAADMLAAVLGTALDDTGAAPRLQAGPRLRAAARDQTA